MAHEVEYEGGRRHRPRQHHRPREPAYDSAYSQYSHHDSDWRPARDAHFDGSPYRRSKHDIQRTDSRTSSSRQWSRSSSSLKATSTMPSSLHSRPSNLTSAPYRRGKGPTVPMYEDEPTAASRRSPSRARSTHRQRSVSAPRAPSPHSSESDSIIDDDEGGEHGESGSDLTDTSSDESDDEREHGRGHDEEEEELVGVTDKNNMYTIHEDVPKPRQRSRSVRRERMEPELVADEDEINQEHQEVPVHVEELLESDPRATHPHPHSSREAVEEDAEMPQQHSHRSRSKYPDERRSRSSHHQPYDEVPVDDRHDRSRHDNHEGHRNYSRDREAKHRRRHSGYSKRKTRPYSPGRSEPPPPPRAFSPPRERSRRSSSQHVQRRRLSFGDSRSSAPRRSKKYYSYASDALPAETTPTRRTHTAAASHVTTPHNVSASKRAFPLGLGNVFGSSHQAPPQQEKPTRLAECFVCMGETPYGELARLKCGHRMCHACLRRFFKLSTKDAQHMPPKCCEEQIPLKHVDGLFDTRFKRSWNKKLTEFTMKNRLYCPSRHCGEPIGSQHIEKKKNGQKFAVCPSCNIKVCTICSGKYHKSRECPKDEETKRFLEQAKEEGWQRCYKCKAMVELKEGCNHMTCRCGAEFCMLCGKKWKGCECPWFNYDLVENDRLVHLDIEPPIVTEDNPFAPRFGPQESAIPYGRDYMSGPRPIRPVLSRPRSSHRSGQSSFDEELMLRRRQVQHDEEMARMLDEEMDGGYDDPDEMDRVGIGRQARHFMNEDYVHGHATAPRMRAPTSMVYVAEPPRSRRARGSSMERRLADRFAESRSTPRRRAAPPPPLGMSPPQSEMLGQMPPSPVTPTRIRRYTLEEDMYNSAPTTRRSERVIPGRLFHDYEVESAIHAPPTRRRSEPPKSSVLAGLTGPGRGMNRVFEWRTHVEPGLPEGERYAVATH